MLEIFPDSTLYRFTKVPYIQNLIFVNSVLAQEGDRRLY